MKINFEFPVVDLLGKPVIENNIPLTFSSFVSGAMINPAVKIGDVLKKYALAQQIAKRTEFDVDLADLKLIKDIIALPDIFAPMIQAQLLLYTDNLK